MKKIRIVLLAMLVLLMLCGGTQAKTAVAEGGESARTAALEEPESLQAGTVLNVGCLTSLTGDFWSDMWGSNTADMDVRALLHGLGTVAWTDELQYRVNPTVVTDVAVQTDADGNKTYTYTISDALKYNDGTRITAADYVFSILLQSAPQMEQIGANATIYQHLRGFDAYHSGRAERFSGVRLLNDTQFSMTIYHGFLPYFYELIYAAVEPCPLHVIVPGCRIADDGTGAQIVPAEDANGAPVGAFTSEVLTRTVLDAQTGYRTHPSVTGGAYQLQSYDEETGVAKFVVNPNYPGNFQGRKPMIEMLTLRTVSNETLVDDILSGTVDLVNKVSDGKAVAAGLARQAEGKLQTLNYLRAGYGFLNFSCETGVTRDVVVRRAIAMCLDKQAFIDAYLGESGWAVNGCYGLGQWMVQRQMNTLSEAIPGYDFDPAAAEALLIADGWTLNEAGTDYVKGVDCVRCKQENGELVRLSVSFGKTKDSRAADLLDSLLSNTLREIGFEFSVTERPFSEVLAHYYRRVERTDNLLYLGSNFRQVFDPYESFRAADAEIGRRNTSGIQDEALESLAAALRATQPGDEETFLTRWLAMEQRYCEVLPTLPIYSNEYFDFFCNRLRGYDAGTHWSWACAVLYAYLDDSAAGA